MPEMKFLDEIPIHIDNTLFQLLGRFQSVSDGIPELLKNAKDQYSRLGITEKHEREIVILVNSASRRVAVLDFAGATSVDFRHWKTWSDPAANRADAASDIEGGHGNGGKGFMVRGSMTTSFIESCRDGRRTKMGYRNDDSRRRFYPAYYLEDGKSVNNVLLSEDDQDTATGHLESLLSGFDLSLDDLPGPSQACFDNRDAFTFVQVNDIRDWHGRRSGTIRRVVEELGNSLVSHPQAALSVETCNVWLVVDGEVENNSPLALQRPDPFPGFEDLPPIPIPDELVDPQSGETVNTGEGDEDTRFLRLHTSARSLRLADLKPLNVVRIRNARNVVDNWSVADLWPSAQAGFIFGEARVPGLTPDHMVGADRNALADTALVRALRAWTADRVAELAARIQEETARNHRPEERNKANEGLDRLRDLMREFLDETSPGTANSGNGQAGGAGDQSGSDTSRDGVTWGNRVDEIVLEGEATSIAMAVGTEIPLVVRAYELTEAGDRLPVRGSRLNPRSSNDAIVSSSESRLLRAHHEGTAQIWFESDEGLESNRVDVEAVRCNAVTIRNAPERLLLQGERIALRSEFESPSGPRSDLLIQASVDEANMGRVSRHGVFTAGGQDGAATVRVRFGSGAADTTTVAMEIGTERVARRGNNGDEGADVPLILLCGTTVPGMEEYPPEQRTVEGGEHEPTIIDFEPEFEHVIFINPDSIESTQVREGRGGRRGIAGIGSKQFLQFLALKCFEILKRLRVRQAVLDGMITELQFRQEFAIAETECADFIEPAYEIARQLTTTEAEVPR